MEGISSQSLLLRWLFEDLSALPFPASRQRLGTICLPSPLPVTVRPQHLCGRARYPPWVGPSLGWAWVAHPLLPPGPSPFSKSTPPQLTQVGPPQKDQAPPRPLCIQGSAARLILCWGLSADESGGIERSRGVTGIFPVGPTEGASPDCWEEGGSRPDTASLGRGLPPPSWDVKLQGPAPLPSHPSPLQPQFPGSLGPIASPHRRENVTKSHFPQHPVVNIR